MREKGGKYRMRGRRERERGGRDIYRGRGSDRNRRNK